MSITANTASSGSSSDSTTTMVPVTRPINNALKANQQRRQATSSPVVVVAAAAAAAAAASSLGSIDDDILASLPVVAPSNYNHAAPTPTASNAHLAIGTRVIVPSLCVIGTLRFLGNTKFKPGTWAGIELDVEGAGKNNGSVQGYVKKKN
ncbi:hypothetical protein BX666DRAFT_1955801 [Dichotomocladium elegans]|nr:hypothetical protein BX666DRAFT_1955801 [Dichotomocladium elegans]